MSKIKRNNFSKSTQKIDNKINSNRSRYLIFKDCTKKICIYYKRESKWTEQTLSPNPSSSHKLKKNIQEIHFKQLSLWMTFNSLNNAQSKLNLTTYLTKQRFPQQRQQQNSTHMYSYGNSKSSKNRSRNKREIYTRSVSSKTSVNTRIYWSNVCRMNWCNSQRRYSTRITLLQTIWLRLI